MELRQLEYFMAVVEHCSFTSAARQLYVSQSTLSKSVKKLEDELGTTLFTQVDQRTVPTEAGQVLYEKSRIILGEAEQTKELISNEMNGTRGRVRIAISCKRAYAVRVAKVVAEFKRENPLISIELFDGNPEEVKDALVRHLADVGIIGCPAETLLPSFDAVTLSEGQYHLVVHKDNPLVKKGSVCFSDLQNEQIIQFSSAFNVAQLVRMGCEAAGFSPKVSTVSDMPEFMFALVNQGSGVTVQPLIKAESVMGFQEWENIVLLPIEDIQSRFAVKMITLKEGYLPPTVYEFVRYAQRKMIEDTL